MANAIMLETLSPLSSDPDEIDARHRRDAFLARVRRSALVSAVLLTVFSPKPNASSLITAFASMRPRKERKFTVAIKLAAKPDLFTLQQFLDKKHHDCPQEVIQALDVVLRAPKMLLESSVVVGRSFFSKESGRKGDLGGGVQYWLGYYQSLRPTQMGLSLNIDLTARSFYDPIPVSEFVAKYLNLRDLSRPLSDQDRMKVRKALKGLKVEITHREYARSYKITGISREPLGRLTFPLDDKWFEV